MYIAELIRWAAIAGMAATLLRWPGPGSPFWALASGRPFVVIRTRQTAAARFWVATPA